MLYRRRSACSTGTGAIVKELSDVSPWLARKIIRRAARTGALLGTGLFEMFDATGRVLRVAPLERAAAIDAA